MELHNSVKIVDKKHKRVGRGHGSGRGKTAGRGTKGQKARRDISLSFEGGALPLIKRMPFLRGKGRNAAIKAPAVEITLSVLNQLPAKSVVTKDLLIEHKIIQSGTKRVKVISTGTIENQLTVQIPVSKGAQAAIEKVGGKVELSSD